MTPEERRLEALRAAVQFFEGQGSSVIASRVLSVAAQFERYLLTGTR